MQTQGHLGVCRFYRSRDKRFQIQPTTDFKYDPQRKKTVVFLRSDSKREQRTRNDHLKTMEEVLQFQVDHEGALPKQTKRNKVECNLRKRFDRVLACGYCGAMERIRVRWSEAHAGPVGKYLLGEATRKGKPFRSNAARNYQAIMKYLEEMEDMIQECGADDDGTCDPFFMLENIYWDSDMDKNEDTSLAAELNRWPYTTLD